MIELLKSHEVHQPLAEALVEHLEQVSLILERQLASDLSAVNSLCKYLELYRGKMLRPVLLLLSGLAANSNDDEPTLTEKHRVVAAVTELIHLATLVHDDVLDEAEVRRRGATINHLWGNESAVILGDYLISNAFHLCSTVGDPTINLALGEITNTMCEGELVQLHHRHDYTVDELLYLEIIRRKTAALIGECCRLGATISGAPQSVGKALDNYGNHLGTAFQIQDDLLDIVGDEAIVGKTLGQDLAKGKLTLPVIHYLLMIPPGDRKNAMQLIIDGDAETLKPLLQERGAVQHSSRMAKEFIEQAKSELSCLPESPARYLLHSLADSVITRKF